MRAQADRADSAGNRLFALVLGVLLMSLAAAGSARAQDLLDETADAGSTDAGLTATEEEELDLGREKVDIEPYTGPPVFLPEGEAPPPPTEVSSQVVKENYPGLETPHFERRIVHYSDNSYMSDGSHKEYYPSGQLYVEGAYEKNRATGAWTFFHPNGSVAKKVTYVDGLPDGEIEVFDEGGKLTRVRSYKRGDRHGKWVDYAYDGDKQLKVRAYEFSEGKPHGEWKIWYKNGAIRQEQNFADGKADGPAVEWARSGEKRAEANFAGGKRHGETVIYRRDGSVVRRTYEQGKIVDQSEENAG